MQASPIDKNRLRESIKEFYALAGLAPPHLADINDKVASIFYTMLAEADKCTSLTILVPSVGTRSITVMWLVGYIKNIIFSKVKESRDTRCITVIIASHRSGLYLASIGM